MQRQTGLFMLSLCLGLGGCGGGDNPGNERTNARATSRSTQHTLNAVPPTRLYAASATSSGFSATRQFPKTSDSYRVSKTATGYLVSSISDTSDVTTITGSTLLQFADAALIVGDNEGRAGQTYRLYRAAFARTPDISGLSFWIDHMNNGVPLLELSRQFQASSEFNNLYGNALSNTSFITLLYQNVLRRTPDQSGMAYWLGLLDSARLTRDDVLVYFSESDENKAMVAPAIDNGIAYLTQQTSLARRYPGDANIQQDPDVLFSEMAEQATPNQLFANWNANTGVNSVALDNQTKPANSPGQQSIRLTTTAGPGGPGTIRTAGLYKYFAGGYEGTLFARWYVKYNANGTFHHSGPRLGGSNPALPTGPGARAGVRPNGADFFYLGAELSGGKVAPTNLATFDFYNYWMGQRGSTFFPDQYFGNSFINSPSVALDTTVWHCIEVQLTLNDPVNGSNGEIAMWINGVEVSRVKSGTLGTWDEDRFQPNPAGLPFEGFQWRNDANLKVNYFQLLHFVDNDPNGTINSVNYDHIVVARKYIGPLQ